MEPQMLKVAGRHGIAIATARRQVHSLKIGEDNFA